MIGTDTNVLVGFLVADHKTQTDRAHAAWVLRSVFSRSRTEIFEVIERLLGTDVFQVEAEDGVRAALQSCRSGKGDFADHLIGHINLAKSCCSTVTIDRSLGGAAGFTKL